MLVLLVGGDCNETTVCPKISVCEDGKCVCMIEYKADETNTTCEPDSNSLIYKNDFFLLNIKYFFSFFLINVILLLLYFKYDKIKSVYVFSEIAWYMHNGFY